MFNLALELIQKAKKIKSKWLDFGACNLKEIPEELSELVWLKEISLQGNRNLY